VYQATLTPASCATSSRRRPGVRRRPPPLGKPASCGDSRSRRLRRNSASAARRRVLDPGSLGPRMSAGLVPGFATPTVLA
jgi:hypothetical protein